MAESAAVRGAKVTAVGVGVAALIGGISLVISSRVGKQTKPDPVPTPPLMTRVDGDGDQVNIDTGDDSPVIYMPTIVKEDPLLVAFDEEATLRKDDWADILLWFQKALPVIQLKANEPGIDNAWAKRVFLAPSTRANLRALEKNILDAIQELRKHPVLHGVELGDGWSKQWKTYNRSIEQLFAKDDPAPSNVVALFFLTAGIGEAFQKRQARALKNRRDQLRARK